MTSSSVEIGNWQNWEQRNWVWSQIIECEEDTNIQFVDFLGPFLFINTPKIKIQLYFHVNLLNYGKHGAFYLKIIQKLSHFPSKLFEQSFCFCDAERKFKFDFLSWWQSKHENFSCLCSTSEGRKWQSLSRQTLKRSIKSKN